MQPMKTHKTKNKNMNIENCNVPTGTMTTGYRGSTDMRHVQCVTHHMQNYFLPGVPNKKSRSLEGLEEEED